MLKVIISVLGSVAGGFYRIGNLVTRFKNSVETIQTRSLDKNAEILEKMKTKQDEEAIKIPLRKTWKLEEEIEEVTIALNKAVKTKIPLKKKWRHSKSGRIHLD